MSLLREQFHMSYDPGAHWQYLNDFALEGELSSAQLVGEGTHFSTWRIKQYSKGSCDVVVKFSNNSFLTQRGERGLLPWQEMMKLLQREKLPLVPPYEVIGREGIVSVMMPFGELPPSGSRQQLVDSKEEASDLQKGLKDLGFVIDDIWQFRQTMGVPFLCDFSDLVRLKN
jgi:hypothetical protein